MKTFILTKLPLICAVVALSLLPTFLKSQVVQTFSYTGAPQTFTVPPCVTSITMVARAPQGQNSSTSQGGLGGIVRGVFTSTPGQVLTIYVGGQNGFNGGALGSSPGGTGGGASDVRVAPFGLVDRVIVAGGGGGGGATNSNAPGGIGGGGMVVGTNFVGGGGGSGANNQGPGVGGFPGGTVGGNGGVGNGSNNGGGGGGGGLTSGGLGGVNSGYLAGLSGSLGLGGAGGGPTGPGGGGGGYYGGGGASGGTNSNAGGGGGSSWTGILTSPSFTAGTVTGDGQITFTYIPNGSAVSGVASPSFMCSGNSVNLIGSANVSYTWSPGGSNSSSLVVSPTSNTTYTLSGTNSFGCVTSVLLPVVVNTGSPTLSISQNSTTICPTNTVVFTASGANSYTWTGGISNGVPFAPLTSGSYTVTGSNGCSLGTAVTGITVTSLPVVAISNPTVMCANGAATLTAGGAANYTWNPGSLYGPSIVVSPTAATIYTVVGTTSTCAGINTVALAVDPIPTIAVASTGSMICQGSSIVLTASGGLSYTWTPGNLSGPSVTVNPVVSTLYNVTGNNSFGCTSSTSQVVITTPGPTVNLVPSLFQTCVGGSVTLFASGANTYSWSVPGNTYSVVVYPQVTTTYSCTGTHTATGCSNTKTVSISVFTVPLTVSPPTVVCLGNSVTIGATGATTYTWSGGQNGSSILVSPAASTIYVVNAISNTLGLNCATSGSVVVTVNPLPLVTAAATRTSMCRNETVTVTATGATTYTWSNLTYSASFVLKPTNTATYVLTVIGADANACLNTATVTIRSNACVGMEELSSSRLNVFQVFPNPNSGNFTIRCNSELNLKLVNEIGQIVQNIQLNKDSNYSAYISALAPGIYFVIAKSENKTTIEKIIVTK